MCVPCVAAVPGLGEILLFVLLVLLVTVGLCFKYVVQALPYIGLAVAAVSVALYRWFSGAVLRKDFREADADYWDRVTRYGQRGPRFTRSVRATSRLALVGLAVGGLTNWLATVIVVSALSLTVSGLAAYGRRDRIITTCRELTGRGRELVRR